MTASFLARTRGARKLIVVDLGFLGDSIHLIPALWELQTAYADAEIHTLSAVVGAEALKLAPCVTKAWAFPLTPESPPWWRHWDIIAALRREHFEVAYNFSGADRTIFLTALTGAPHRLAHLGGRDHFWARWLIAHWAPRQDRSLPVYEQRRRVLAACGFTIKTAARFDLRIPAEARTWAAQAISTPMAHLSINASGPEKEWPLANWIDLAKSLLTQRPELLLAATASSKPRERERLGQLMAGVNDPRLRAFDHLSLPQLAALLERSQYHLGADSGVLHLAMALGVPTLGLFRQYEGLQEWLPRGQIHRHLAASRLDEISVEAVVNEIGHLP